ncbi:hypothetical protein [Mahella sp.]|uniref:hypothetical protein n=1 Tax=Mahella sp. TaxID=2798721 RepID=UPI0025C43CDF|nr:hypothetical protein [Mahella sp.]MBZ4665618.1 hypothetical protein [Mahella sp.]
MRALRIYKRAYHLMDVPIEGGDCGRLCGRICCAAREGWGIYLLPGEERIVRAKMFHMKKHRRRRYNIPRDIPYLYFASCDDVCGKDSTARRYRPIQCRTYPLMPYMSGGRLMLIKNPIGQCPLSIRQLNREFINRCFQAWEMLITIPEVAHLIEYDSRLIRQGKPFAPEDCRPIP